MNARTDFRRRWPEGVAIRTWTTPDGWPLRRVTWPAIGPATGPATGPADAPATGDAARGTILVQGGRGDFLEKYIETFADLSAAGWRVEAFDWRGQGGSGRLAPDVHVGHVEDFGLWIDDLSAVWGDLLAATPGPHLILGHSMGGHLVLRALVEHAIDPAAAVLVAPMLGFRGGIPVGIGARVANWMALRGDPARPAWRGGEKPGSSLIRRQALLTRDADRYADELYWHEANPDTRLGPASWRWVERAYASNAALFAPGGLEGVAVPVLILSATADGLVDPAAIRRAATRLPAARLQEYGAGAAHELLRETDAVRDDAMARILAFLNDATSEATKQA